MLNRSKILQELSTHIPAFSSQYTSDYTAAISLWSAIAHDPHCAHMLASQPHTLSLPTWEGPAGATHKVSPLPTYDTIAIDGSQIYPDRHEGIACFVINIGTVFFQYRATESSVAFNSTPYLLSPHQAEIEDGNKEEMVNAMRTEREFTYGLELMRQQSAGTPRLLLMDGSLIFWHLQVTQTEAKQKFLSRYVKLLDEYHKHQQLFAGYISLPQSRELINIVRTVIQLQTGTLPDLPTVVDMDIAAKYLQPNQRSILFQNHSRVTEQYPEHSKPYFFYYNTGNEIARIEIPAWIATNPNHLKTIEGIIADQCIKGFGYPIALAEAHEQAVVGGADRAFFYEAIQKMLRNNGSQVSQKLMKKRRMPI